MGRLVTGDGCGGLRDATKAPSADAKLNAIRQQIDIVQHRLADGCLPGEKSALAETLASLHQDLEYATGLAPQPHQEVDIVKGMNSCSMQLAGESEDASAEPEVVRAGDEFITGFGLVLTSWVEPSKAVIDRPSRVTPFHSVRVPPMCIKDYLQRIRKYFVCSDECYVLALIYIDRAAKIDAVMAVCALNVHRLLLVTVMLAAKFHDDIYYSNAYYAKVGGMALKEVNTLEARLLKMLSWHTLVEPVEYQLYHSLVCKATTEDPSALTQPRKVQL